MDLVWSRFFYVCRVWSSVQTHGIRRVVGFRVAVSAWSWSRELSVEPTEFSLRDPSYSVYFHGKFVCQPLRSTTCTRGKHEAKQPFRLNLLVWSCSGHCVFVSSERTPDIKTLRATRSCWITRISRKLFLYYILIVRGSESPIFPH